MEALSPRDANANVAVPPKLIKQVAQKSKATALKAPLKGKDHPLPPPSDVHEPPSSDRPNGAMYQTGRCLGKGGFAICYEGELSGTKQVYALKIVRSQMPQKKMEQKVSSQAVPSIKPLLMFEVSNRAANPLEDETSQYRTVPSSIHFPAEHIHCS